MSDEREIRKALRALESAAYTAIAVGADESDVQLVYETGVREALDNGDKMAKAQRDVAAALARMNVNAA